MTAARPPADIERRIGRLLIAMTDIAVTALAVGVLLLAVHGVDPLSGGPNLQPDRLLAQLDALDPAGFLWLGLVIVLAAPVARVIAAGIAYAVRREWRMLAISIAILVIIVTGIATAVATGA